VRLVLGCLYARTFVLERARFAQGSVALIDDDRPNHTPGDMNVSRLVLLPIHLQDALYRGDKQPVQPIPVATFGRHSGAPRELFHQQTFRRWANGEDNIRFSTVTNGG